MLHLLFQAIIFPRCDARCWVQLLDDALKGPSCTAPYLRTVLRPPDKYYVSLQVTHMPPEPIIEGKMSKSVDVYGFGVLLWEMCAFTSKFPHHSVSLRMSERSIVLLLVSLLPLRSATSAAAQHRGVVAMANVLLPRACSRISFEAVLRAC